jgi:hypothetical protein
MRIVVLTLVCSWLGTGVQASPVLWTITDAEFEDGGAAFGSFLWDPDSDTISNVSITTTGGGLFAGASYDTVLSGGAAELAVVSNTPDLSNTPALLLSFMMPLDPGGGPIDLVDYVLGPGPSVELTCLNSSCSGAESTQLERFMFSGGLVGVVVPLPPAVLLFGSAFALMGIVVRRQSLPDDTSVARFQP